MDREGLEALTMRRLGRELGVEAMSLYHHLPSKAALLGLLVEAVYLEVEVPEEIGDDWPGALGRIGEVLRVALSRHPNVLPVMATHPPTSPGALRLIDTALGHLVRLGMEPVRAAVAMNAVAAFVVGYALADVGLPPAGFGEIDPGAQQRTLREQQEELAQLAQVIGEGFDYGVVFEAGLEALVTGFARRR